MPSMAGAVYNVCDYGAKGDGKTLDSPAINAAIEAAVKEGGGQVLLPAGTYLCGSIRLKSNIDLHLAAGCTILAASPKDSGGRPRWGATAAASMTRASLSTSPSIRTADIPISITRSSGPRGRRTCR